jgi:hypothetical protein
MTKLKRGASAPIPTPADIETVLAGMLTGADPFLRWCQLDYQSEHERVDPARRRVTALGRSLYWAETVDPDNKAGDYWGAGTTPAAAAASAWIHACLVECWWRDRLDECEAMFRESDYRSIPRLVLAGWAFDLFDVPTIAADGGKIQ